jgi:hypothetical protein
VVGFFVLSSGRSPEDLLRLVPRLDPLIERLQDTRIHRGNHIDGGIKLFFRHPGFPCVRKAAIYSRITEPHHRDRKPHEHLFPLAQTLDGMGVFIEGSKIGFL